MTTYQYAGMLHSSYADYVDAIIDNHVWGHGSNTRDVAIDGLNDPKLADDILEHVAPFEHDVERIDLERSIERLRAAYAREDAELAQP